jgi:hypothetical protein
MLAAALTIERSVVQSLAFFAASAALAARVRIWAWHLLFSAASEQFLKWLGAPE